MDPREYRDNKTYLYMFCPENRVPREIFWSGFGFQVWCQMLTHLIQAGDNTIFLIDEPDIYLHSELQRQLLDILRNLGPDIVIATHSTEIVTEANPDEILVIDKKRNRSRRIKKTTEVGNVFEVLGSNINPILTQFAKTRRVLFVEGKDYQIIGRLARKAGFVRVGNRSDFAVVPIEGFNPEKMKNIKIGMEATLGSVALGFAVLDRDFRSDEECESIKKQSEKHVDHVWIHPAKEIENYLLVPTALDRAAKRAIKKRYEGRTAPAFEEGFSLKVLENFAATRRNYVVSQHSSQKKLFLKASNPGIHESSISEEVMGQFDKIWNDPQKRLELIPGKEAFGALNAELQKIYSIGLTPGAVVDAMQQGEVPAAILQLLEALDAFACTTFGRLEPFSF